MNLNELLINLGYTKEEVIKMTKPFPQIYSLSIENIKQKIEFYDSVNMHKLLFDAPITFIQSVALSYARYEFYKEKGININMSNYNPLFISQKKFEKSFKVTKEELLRRYNYEEYMEGKKDARTS